MNRSWFKYLPYLVAASIVVLQCYPILSSGVWYAGDILYEFYFNRAYGFSKLKQGEVPLWNPYQFAGFPFLASLQSGLFYPLNVVFILFSIETALVLTVVIHLYLAWLFAYILLKAWFHDTLGAFCGATTFMLCGPLVAHIYAGHITYLNAYPWLPLILHFYRIGFKDSQSTYFIIAGSLAGVQFLTGYPQISLFTFYAVLLYSIYAFMQKYKTEKPSGVFSLTIPFVFSGVVAFLISAVQLLPTLFFNRYSGRAGGVSEEFASSFSMPPENTLTFLFPSILGDGVNSIGGGPAYWGRWLVWEILPYCGIFALLCFIISFSWPNKRTWLLGIFSFLGLLSAYGMYGYLYEFAYHYLPGFSLFRVPGRFLIPMAFGLSILSCLLLVKAKDLEVSKAFSKKIMITSITLVVLSLFLLLMIIVNDSGKSLFWQTLLAFSNKYDKAHFGDLPLNSETFLMGSHALAVKKIILGACLLSVIAIFAYITKRKAKVGLFRYGICVFIVLDLVCFSHKYFQGKGQYDHSFPLEVNERLQNLNHKRIATKLDTQHLSIGSLSAVPHVGGYDPAQLKVYTEFVNILSDRKAEDELVISEPIKPGNLLKLMSVEYVLVQKGMAKYPDGKLLGTYSDMDMYQLMKSVPRAYYAKGFAVEPDKEKLLNKLKESYLQNNRVVLYEKPEGVSLENVEQDSIEWMKDSAHEIKLKLKASKTRLLILTDAYYPLWDAYLNGDQLKIYQANHMFRAVVIPEGEWELTFQYNKKPFQFSLFLTIFGYMICIGAILLFLKGRKAGV